MKASIHRVSRNSPQQGRIQTQRGGFITESQDAQPYGLQRHLPEDAMAVALQPLGQQRRVSILGYTEQAPYGLEQGEVALYSEHGQVLYYKNDGAAHLEAKGKLSIHSDQEDLYSLLKDLLTAIKGLTTAKIDTQVNGGAVALAPSGTSPIANASGTNAGVGISKDSEKQLKDLEDRLEKLLQKGEKPQTAEQREQKQAEEMQRVADEAWEKLKAGEQPSGEQGDQDETKEEKPWKAMDMGASLEGKNFIKRYEELRLEPYNAGDGYVTIGYGQVIDDDKLNQSGQVVRELERRHSDYKYPWYEEYRPLYDRCFALKQQGLNSDEIVARLKAEGYKINETLAENLFEANIKYLEDGLNDEENFEGGKPKTEYKNGRLLTQNEFDAVVMFGFNNGRSGMLNASFFQTIQNHKDFNSPAVKQAIVSNWQSYNKVKGKEELGLTYRRNDELQLFFYGDYERDDNTTFVAPANETNGNASGATDTGRFSV